MAAYSPFVVTNGGCGLTDGASGNGGSVSACDEPYAGHGHISS